MCIACITANGNEYAPTSTLTRGYRTDDGTIPTPEIHETVDQTYYTPRIGKKPLIVINILGLYKI